MLILYVVFIVKNRYYVSFVLFGNNVMA